MRQKQIIKVSVFVVRCAEKGCPIWLTSDGVMWMMGQEKEDCEAWLDDDEPLYCKDHQQ